MYTDCKQTARVLYIFWTGVKYRNLSFRPIAIAIAITNAIGIGIGKGSTKGNANTATIAIGIAITITIANSVAIGNGDGTPRREYLWGLFIQQDDCLIEKFVEAIIGLHF